jgi:hypothetical protein
VEPGTRFRWRVTFGNTIEELNGDEMFRAPTPPVGTAIRYSTDGGGSGPVSITIEDPLGRVVRTLEGPAGPGVHSVLWDLRSDDTADAVQGRGEGTPSEWAFRQLVPAGSYRVVIRAGGESASRTVKVRDEPVEGVRQAHPRR